MIKYLCLDDEEKLIKPYVRELMRASDDLEIIVKHPKSFDEQILSIVKELKDSYDGLILDLRLDEKTKEGEGRANFGAPALAQELRSRASDDRDLSHPIILWSTDEKLDNSYYRDTTAQDLFDLVYRKAEIKKNAPQIATQLIYLVEGYKKVAQVLKKKEKSKFLSSQERLRLMLGLQKKQNFLDPRILGYFDGIKSEDSLEIYKYSRFIMKDLIRSSGPLIDEKTLAARLGIDISKSEDWQILKNDFLGSFAFTGVFAEGWERWWNYLVEEWWKDKIKDRSLRQLTAEQRVIRLKTYTNLEKLIPAIPIKKEYSSKFWTICQVDLKPLTPINGLILKQHDRQPWQDFLYVSEKIVKSGRLGKLEIDPLEQSKL